MQYYKKNQSVSCCLWAGHFIGNLAKSRALRLLVPGMFHRKAPIGDWMKTQLFGKAICSICSDLKPWSPDSRDGSAVKNAHCSFRRSRGRYPAATLGQLTTACSSGSGGYDALSWPPRILHLCTPHIFIIKNKILIIK